MMEGAVLQTDNRRDLELILEIARKMGIYARKLSKSEIEDIGLAMAISEGRTGEYVNAKSFLEELKDGSKD